MKTVTMGEEYTLEYESRLTDGRKELARIWPYPGVVVVDHIDFTDDELTPEQALELARSLVRAARDARHLHAPEDPSEEILHDDRDGLENDLVARLRDEWDRPLNAEKNALLDEAADEIERLRSALEAKGTKSAHLTATDEMVAQKFHEAYERLAPDFGYETRVDSAVPWADVPDKNKALMVAVAGEVRADLQRG